MVGTSISGNNLIRNLEPMLSEIWREFSYPDGTKNIEAGEWIGRKVEIDCFDSSSIFPHINPT
jgi:hypothetical protein